jgi:DNA end-binding protein Ku
MARPIWKGSITFGLVNIPIQLETAIHEKTVHFHMLSKDGSCRLRRKLYCPETGKEFDFGETARGIEISKGRYALMDEKEIKKIKPEQGRSIEIVQFIKLEEVDPLYFDRAYFVMPTEGSVKSYKLLYEAMKQSERIALAHFVMRDREYLAAIRVLGHGLVLHTMHYVDEVDSLDDGLPSAVGKSKSGAKEVQIAMQLIEAMTRKLDLSEFKDDYREELEKMIEQKKHGKKIEVADDEERPAPKNGETVNLMDALRQSLKTTSSNGRSSSSSSGNGRHAVNGHRVARPVGRGRTNRRMARG